MIFDKVNMDFLLEFTAGRRLIVDSRKVRSGDIFVAIKGTRVDGNDYVDDALMRGAFGVIAERGTGDKILRVDDVAGLLVGASSFLLGQSMAKRIVIGGSNGKTTTKDVAHHFLSHLGPAFKTPGNLNTEIGVPIAILENRDDLLNAKYAVFEIGTGARGDISFLTNLIRPDIAVLLNFGTAHRGCFKDESEHLKEKLDVFSLATENSVSITSADDCRLKGYVDSLPSRNLFFGLSGGDFQLSDYTYFDGDTGLAFKTPAGQHYVRLKGLWNRGQLLDFGAAYLVAKACDLEEPILCTGDLRLLSSDRFGFKTIRGVRLFTDCYNSSLESVSVAAEAIGRLKKHKSFAVIGSILEQGRLSEETHRELGELLKGFDHVLVYDIDEEIDAVTETREVALKTSDPSEIAAWLKDRVVRDDIVYFKASRGVKLEQVVDKYLELIDVE